ncbi:hypothetical protein [Rugosimonospora africana]|uniref:Uncharacterized protein n=1 Tax=Rugosimonospora africana TaxID=556532 RepID=A0A8J3VNJ5_9ACTN|nr:hypothetical protein [Rugosimonospora africana]GIH13045.1 hypothetical protein Raf01_12170 [Rugosimonospora africana]
MDERQDQPDPELDLAAIDRDPDLNATLDRDTDLDELRDGGPSRTPGTRTTTARTTLIGTTTGRAGRAMTPGKRHPRPGAGPTTTGDATTGGMNTPTGMGTSDANSTGQVGGAPETGARARREQDREEPER